MKVHDEDRDMQVKYDRWESLDDPSWVKEPKKTVKAGDRLRKKVTVNGHNMVFVVKVLEVFLGDMFKLRFEG